MNLPHASFHSLLAKTVLLVSLSTNLLFGAYSRDNTLETVYDDQTGLTWQDNAIVSTQTLDWNASIDDCEALNFAGLQDWRLPSQNELYSITDITREDPAIDPTFQNVASGDYWSSTSDASFAELAWVVGFTYGLEAPGWPKSTNYYVRCVRGGQIIPSPSPAVAVPLFGLPGFVVLSLLLGLGGFGFFRRK